MSQKWWLPIPNYLYWLLLFYTIRYCDENQINITKLNEDYPHLNITSDNIGKATFFEQQCKKEDGKSKITLDPKRRCKDQFTLIEEKESIKLKIKREMEQLDSSKFCLDSDFKAHFCKELGSDEEEGKYK